MSFPASPPASIRRTLLPARARRDARGAPLKYCQHPHPKNGVERHLPSARSNDNIVVFDTAVIAILDRLAISAAFEMRLSNLGVLIATRVSARSSCFVLDAYNIHIRSSRNSQDRANEAQSPTDQHRGEL
jgi:hypothetical protein